MSINKTISFRSQLSGALADFLADEHMACLETGQALIELVVRLSSYQEEGVRLFPKVVVCDDVTQVCSLLQAGESIAIGRGPKGAGTMNQALKRCAPLARNGWSVYVHRTRDDFQFGILREPLSPIALDIRDSIAGLGGEVPVLITSQLGEKAVEVVGGNGSRLVVHLSAVRENHPSPREALESLATSISRGRDDDGEREALESFLRSALSRALQRGHGALVAVLNDNEELPKSWVENDGRIDGVRLDTPLDLAGAVKKYGDTESAATLGKLLSLAELLEGMLSADGITLLGPSGKIYGYNFFVKTPQTEGALPSSMIGGARRRAFRTLQGMVDQGQLAAAFFRSSDGAAEFRGGEIP